MCPEEILACRIFEQAIEDYNDLKKNGQEKGHDGSGFYSLKDIEHFFNSKWCARLLDVVNSKLTGQDILSKIQLSSI